MNKISNLALMFVFVSMLGSVHTWLPGAGPVIAQPSSGAASRSADSTERKPPGMTDDEWEKMKAKRPLPFDNGPTTIDVSGYSAEMQRIYHDTFTKRCSRCHTIARPINAPYALPDEWSRYIKKMMKKPGSGITPESARQIYKFLVYDSEKRKKALIERKLGGVRSGSNAGEVPNAKTR